MGRIYMIRHGETEYSRRGVYCGRTDPPLSDEGRMQSERAGVRLEALLKVSVSGPVRRAPGIIYTSPLKRTFETSQIINRQFGGEITFEADDRLMERDFGEWENMAFKDIQERYPAECGRWMEDWVNFKIPGGESMLQSFERVTDFARGKLYSEGNELSDRKCDNIVIVAHQGTIAMLITHMLGLKPEMCWRFRIDAAAITAMDIDEYGYAFLAGLNV